MDLTRDSACRYGQRGAGAGQDGQGGPCPYLNPFVAVAASMAAAAALAVTMVVLCNYVVFVARVVAQIPRCR